MKTNPWFWGLVAVAVLLAVTGHFVAAGMLLLCVFVLVACQHVSRRREGHKQN